MSGLSLETCQSNLKSVPLTGGHLTPKNLGDHVTVATPPFPKIYKGSCPDYSCEHAGQIIKFEVRSFNHFGPIFARDSIYAKRAYDIAIPSVCLSVCLSVTRVIHAKTAEVRIMQFSPYSSPIPLGFAH